MCSCVGEGGTGGQQAATSEEKKPNLERWESASLSLGVFTFFNLSFLIIFNRTPPIATLSRAKLPLMVRFLSSWRLCFSFFISFFRSSESNPHSFCRFWSRLSQNLNTSGSGSMSIHIRTMDLLTWILDDWYSATQDYLENICSGTRLALVILFSSGSLS